MIKQLMHNSNVDLYETIKVNKKQQDILIVEISEFSEVHQLKTKDKNAMTYEIVIFANTNYELSYCVSIEKDKNGLLTPDKSKMVISSDALSSMADRLNEMVEVDFNCLEEGQFNIGNTLLMALSYNRIKTIETYDLLSDLIESKKLSDRVVYELVKARLYMNNHLIPQTEKLNDFIFNLMKEEKDFSLAKISTRYVYNLRHDDKENKNIEDMFQVNKDYDLYAQERKRAEFDHPSKSLDEYDIKEIEAVTKLTFLLMDRKSKRFLVFTDSGLIIVTDKSFMKLLTEKREMIEPMPRNVDDVNNSFQFNQKLEKELAEVKKRCKELAKSNVKIKAA